MPNLVGYGVSVSSSNGLVPMLLWKIRKVFQKDMKLDVDITAWYLYRSQNLFAKYKRLCIFSPDMLKKRIIDPFFFLSNASMSIIVFSVNDDIKIWFEKYTVKYYCFIWKILKNHHSCGNVKTEAKFHSRDPSA